VRTCPMCGSKNLKPRPPTERFGRQGTEEKLTDCVTDDDYGEETIWICDDCNDCWETWFDEDVDQVEY